MKKILFSIALISSAVISFAQLSVGPKAGANFSNITGDNSSDYKYKVGFNVGAMLNYSFSSALSVQPELVYSTKGAKQSYSSTTTVGSYTSTSSSTGTWTLSYLDIPLLLQAKLGTGTYFQAGPQFSLLMGAKYTYTNTSTVNNNTTTSSGSSTDKSGLSSTDFGIALGTGYQAESGLNFGLRACIGLSNINSNSSSSSSSTSSSTPSNHNMAFQVSLGYMFGSGGKGHHRR